MSERLLFMSDRAGLTGVKLINSDDGAQIGQKLGTKSLHLL